MTSTLKTGAACPRALTPELESYLRLLAGDTRSGCFFNVRTRRRGSTQMRQSFVDVDHIDALAERLASIAGGADVYVGCVPRQERVGGRTGLASAASVAWVDVDSPDAIERIRHFEPAATLIVASGSPGAAHGYWQLKPSRIDEVEELNRRLAHALGGDPLWAATSILRPPGTRNHKRTPAQLVRGVGGIPGSFSANALRQALPPAPTPRVPQAPTTARRRGDHRLLTIAPPVYVARLLDVEVPRSGFVNCPFHEDRTPSLKAYPTPERGWACYSNKCRLNGSPRGGSIFDLAAALWGVEPRGSEFMWLRDRLTEIFAPVDRGP